MASAGCGPIAISLIIGVSAEAVCEVLGSDRESTNSGDLIPVLKHFNYQTRTVEDWCDEPRLAGPLVTSWLKRRPYHLRNAPLLLLAEFRGRPGCHWLAVRHMEDERRRRGYAAPRQRSNTYSFADIAGVGFKDYRRLFWPVGVDGDAVRLTFGSCRRWINSFPSQRALGRNRVSRGWPCRHRACARVAGGSQQTASASSR
jgi:hypothetical protein